MTEGAPQGALHAALRGIHRLGPESGRLLIKTGRSGLGRRAGHDLTIEMTRWSAEAVIDPDVPANSTVTVEVEVNSLEPREGTGGIKPLTDADRAEIKRIATQRILRAAQHPTIAFRSTTVTGTPESFVIEGELTVRGRTRPLTVRGSARIIEDGPGDGRGRPTEESQRAGNGDVASGGGDGFRGTAGSGPARGAGTVRIEARATVVQSAFSITPYSAFFGALKLADPVDVVFTATLP